MALNIKSLLCEEHEMEKEFFKRDHCLRDYRLFNSEECAYNNELEPIQLFDVPVVKEMVPEYTKEQFLRKACGGGKDYIVNVYKIEMKNGDTGIMRLVSSSEYKVLQLIK